MATTSDICTRLLTALEDLVSQETVLIRAADFAGVLAVQARTLPLVRELAALAPTATPGLRARALSLIVRRAQSLDEVARDIERVRSELSEMQASQQRAALLAPVYGSSTAVVAGQLSAVG